MRLRLIQAELNGIWIGTGGPDGAIEAEQGQFYLDETGLVGAVLFIKQLADVAGDKTLGWIAIG